MVTIYEEDGKYYWFVDPYRDTFYTTLVDNPNSFEMVLQAIKEYENMRRKPRTNEVC